MGKAIPQRPDAPHHDNKNGLAESAKKGGRLMRPARPETYGGHQDGGGWRSREHYASAYGSHEPSDARTVLAHPYGGETGGGGVPIGEAETSKDRSGLDSFHYSGEFGATSVARKLLIYLVGAAGLEPATPSFEG
jgi:hypothetical protein